MKKTALFILLSFVLMSCSKVEKNKSRNIDFNFDWKFQLGDIENGVSIEVDDSDWRTLNLPHDWSVEASFDSTLEGCTGYLPGGVGWYRKHFASPEASDKITYILFDGIYNNADIWLNGTQLGFHPYGYSPFYYDITLFLNTDGRENVLAVKVDHTRYADSRWYTGSGIYRNVELITVDKLHIPIWGTFVTTPEVTENNATINIEINVKNYFGIDRKFDLVTEFFNPSGKKVARVEEEYEVPPGNKSIFNQEIKIQNPELWDTEHPNLYTAITSILVDGQIVDEYETRFGIRTIKFDANEGFFLNGKNVLIKGVCLHHDAGLVGAAVPKGVWRRRLEMLRDGGCNAIRTAHNPPSKEFLDLCDEMGFLVQDEFFDEMDNPKDKRKNMNEQSVDYITRGYTEHFQEWGETDLKTTMLRDRNHPSIIQWSIGNEIEWTYPRYQHATGYFDAQWSGNYFWTPPHIGPKDMKNRYDESPKGEYVLAETAQKISAWTKELDTTRPVTANCILPSASHVTGYADALDVVGYSYRRVVYDYAHEHFPDKVVMGTENLGQWHEWKAVIDRPFISGLFLWTGIDYMGEANGGWPSKGSGSGLLDLGGFKKPSWHFYKTLWSQEPHIYMATQTAEKSLYKVDESGAIVEKDPGAWERRLWSWHPVNEFWNYGDNESIIVEVYSNCNKVELFLNDNSLGTKMLADFEDRIYRWAVPYQSGRLVAVGKKNNGNVKTELITASEPESIVLTIDKNSLKADSYDVAHIIAQLVDENGTPVKNQERTIQFNFDGEVKLLGVDNGAQTNVQDFQSNTILTNQGRCLLIVQSTLNKSNVKITASSENLKMSSVTLKVK